MLTMLERMRLTCCVLPQGKTLKVPCIIAYEMYLRWPKRVNHKSVYQNTNQFSKTQISLPKHKTISQNTNQFPKTQISLPKHKTISQNTNQFTKTQNNFSKHKSVYQNTNQFLKTQTNFVKHKSKDWALALLLSESLERTHSQDFPRPTWRLQICCR